MINHITYGNHNLRGMETEVFFVEGGHFSGNQGCQSEKVKEPQIEKPDDIILRITSTAICGSDLHLIHGMVPNLPEDYIIGHEPMGIVEETGPEVTRVKRETGWWCLSPSPAESAIIVGISWKASVIDPIPTERRVGISGIPKPSGLCRGQAEYLRVPFGNFVPFVVPEESELEDEKLLFLSDIVPTARVGSG